MESYLTQGSSSKVGPWTENQVHSQEPLKIFWYPHKNTVLCHYSNIQSSQLFFQFWNSLLLCIFQSSTKYSNWLLFRSMLWQKISVLFSNVKITHMLWFNHTEDPRPSKGNTELSLPILLHGVLLGAVWRKNLTHNLNCHFLLLREPNAESTWVLSIHIFCGPSVTFKPNLAVGPLWKEHTGNYLSYNFIPTLRQDNISAHSQETLGPKH